MIGIVVLVSAWLTFKQLSVFSGRHADRLSRLSEISFVFVFCFTLFFVASHAHGGLRVSNHSGSRHSRHRERRSPEHLVFGQHSFLFEELQN